MRVCSYAILLILFIAGSAAAGMANGRYALIVGNSAYEGAALLTSPGNDGRAMAAAPEGLGFEPTLLLD